MRISNISANIPNIKLKNIQNKQQNNNYQSVTFGKDEKGHISKANMVRAGAGAGALMALVTSLSGCGPAQNTLPPSVNQSEQQAQGSQETLDQMGANLDAANPAGSKISLVDVGFVSMPVTEFYFTNVKGQVVYTPDKDLPRNDQGSVIVTITEEKSEDVSEGNTLGEIFAKTYSEAIDAQDPEYVDFLRNKFIDEVIQANPSLSRYVHLELGDNADSYDDIASLNLYQGKSSSDQALDTRLLIIPDIVYQVQGTEKDDVTFCQSSNTYAPSINSASIVKGEDQLLDGEYSSFADMVHSAYGEDINDEAYIKQLTGYKNYISNITNKKVNIYLYSLLDEEFTKLM